MPYGCCSRSGAIGHGDQLAETFIDPTELFAVVSLLQAWRAQQEKIAAMEAWLQEDTHRRPDLIALRTVPGIGVVLGLSIVLGSGEVARFNDVGQYTSYCRLVPALRFSGGPRGRESEAIMPVDGTTADRRVLGAISAGRTSG